MLTFCSELIAKQFTRDMIFRFLRHCPYSARQGNLKVEVLLSENTSLSRPYYAREIKKCISQRSSFGFLFEESSVWELIIVTQKARYLNFFFVPRKRKSRRLQIPASLKSIFEKLHDFCDKCGRQA